MRIGYDAKRLYSNFTGLGNYSRALVKNLQEQYPEHEYNLYTPLIHDTPESANFLSNPNYRTHLSHSSFKAYWRSFSIQKQLEKDGIELYHGPSNELPFHISKSRMKSVVTIHDLIFRKLPETYPFIDRKIYDIKFRRSCEQADRVIAISESTKADIMDYYGVDPKKIQVIYQSCNPIFYDEHILTENRLTNTSINLPKEYLLYVGSIEKRKNLLGIIKSYKHLTKDLRIPLVVIGGIKDKPYWSEIEKLIAKDKLESLVHIISDLKDNQSLLGIYKNAQALVYPSFYEGFGLPVAEALLCKTPAITSATSSLPEAGGPNSLYVDPRNPEEIAVAISKAVGDSGLRKNMIEKGFEYANRTFSRKVVTKEMMSCYESIIKA